MSSGGGRLGASHRARSQVVALSYAGVRFELVISGALSFELPAEYHDYVAPADAYPTAARVTCAVQGFASPIVGKLRPNEVEYEEYARGFGLRGHAVSGDIDELSEGHFVASCRVVPEPMGWAALLRFIAAGIIERVGGVNLHAAALAMDGQAVLLTGPSGAGKSTACDLSPGARCLAFDQVVVFPWMGDAWAWALPWGEATQLPRAEVPALPVGACLRVTRGTPTTRVWAASAEQVFFELRSAVVVKEMSVAAEERRLESLSRTFARVPVGFLSTVLGERADVAIRGWRASGRGVAA